MKYSNGYFSTKKKGSDQIKVQTMRLYNFTAQRKKIYRLYVTGRDFRDIAREVKISAARVGQIVEKIKENVPKAELEKIKREIH